MTASENLMLHTEMKTRCFVEIIQCSQWCFLCAVVVVGLLMLVCVCVWVCVCVEFVLFLVIMK